MNADTLVTRSYEQLRQQKRTAVTEYQAEQVLAFERMYSLRDGLLHVLRAYMPELEAYDVAYLLAETLTSAPEEYRVQFAERVKGLDDDRYIEALQRCYVAIRRSISQWGDL